MRESGRTNCPRPTLRLSKGRFNALRRAPGPLDELTPRERQVLELMAEGRSNLAIAGLLGLTEKTVEGNVRIILSKLGLEPATADHRRVLAVLTFLRGG